MASRRLREWTECDFTWDNPPDPFTWDDVWIATNVVKMAMGAKKKDFEKWQECDDKDKKKLIKLICIVKGERFEESKFTNECAKIDIEDIELLAEKVLRKKITISFDEGE